MYDTTMYQLANVLYTSLPIMLYAILDKEMKKAEFLEKYIYYQDGKNKKYFNFEVFISWYAKGIIQSFLLLYILKTFFE